MPERDCDVVVIGAGPTGLTLANLLGAAGVRVVLVERNETTVQEPRAVSIDDEALRTMQAAGLIDEVIEDVALDYGAHYFTPEGVCFAKVEPKTREYGYPRRSAFTQPKLEATLRDGLERFGNVRAVFGHACERVTERDGAVEAVIRRPGGDDEIISASYLVGCDGGRSMIRRAIGANLAGSTYEERWLIVDLASTKERFRQTRVLCNPTRPVITLPGPHGIRRYEFMLRAGETEDEVTSPEFVRALLAAHGPDADEPVVRRRVYTFHARVADRWRRGRILLAGDAAHLSPPFAGQGMNSGVRDAHNLAWKLAAVVKGSLGEGVLDSYERERSPHAAALIQLAINIGRVMMPTSRLQARLVQSGFRAAGFVPPLHAYFAQMRYKPKPFYGDGFLVQGDALRLVGRMFPQPTLEMRDRSAVKLDDLVGDDFALLAIGPDAQSLAAKANAADLGLAKVRTVAVLPARFNADRAGASDIPAGRDVDDVLGGTVPASGETLLLLRPDRYVAAATRATSAEDVAAFGASIRALVAKSWAQVPGARGAPIGQAAE
jgi:3-(3-hydroxy-phenyl)propionate hydroxylase